MVTDSTDERAILGHGNGLARPHAHDGADGAREGSAATVFTDRRREMLMARTCNKEPSPASTNLAAVPETAATNPAASACSAMRPGSGTYQATRACAADYAPKASRTRYQR